jgi:nucleoside-diphosphate-sugar epimerase
MVCQEVDAYPYPMIADAAWRPSILQRVKYFLTGATGFIGGRVARQLVAAGHQVVAIARNPSRATDLQALGVVVREGDVTVRESLRAPMRGTDGVFHIAGWYKLGTRDKSPGQKINVDGTRNVLEVMKELGVPRGVYTSTLAVYSDTHGRLVDENYKQGGPWLSEYDRTKWVAHYEVAEPMMKAGLPLVIVQPGLVYGPGDPSPVRDTFVQYLQRKMPMLPEQTAYAWGYVDDVACGHVLAMEKGRAGECYNLAGPAHTLIEAFEMAEQITGIKPTSMRASPGMLKFMSALMRPVGAVVPLPETYSAEMLRVLAGVTYLGSSAKAQRELGFTARPLAEGLRETLAYEMRQLGMPARESSRDNTNQSAR